MRLRLVVAAALFGVSAVAATTLAAERPVAHVTVREGDSLRTVATRVCPSSILPMRRDLITSNPGVTDPPPAGDVLHYHPDVCTGGAPSTTTTTTPSSTSSTSSLPTSTATSSTTVTPSSSSVTVATTTSLPSTTTTLPPNPSGFAVVPVGGTLPSEATCASRVVRMTENRPENAQFNSRRGTNANNTHTRVTGNYIGTTDEIIQWAACKWGLNVNWARAQAAQESWWIQTTLSDYGSNTAGCVPGHQVLGQDGRPGLCPESVGLLQTRYSTLDVRDAFEDNNAIGSTAYNADYVWALWRQCFDGQGGGNDYFWLNSVERGRDYAFGDGLGCMGVWFSGRWYTDAALGYMNNITNYVNVVNPDGSRGVWNSQSFGPARPVSGGTPSTSTTPTSSIPGSSTSTSTSPGSTSLPPLASTTTTTTQPPGASGVWQDITPSNLSLTGSNNYGVSSIVIDPRNALILYAGTNYQGLWKSVNGGNTWFKVSTGPGGNMLDQGRNWTLAIDPFNSNTIWTTSGYGTGGPLRSSDGGSTWVKLSAGGPTQYDDVYSIALDPYTQGHIVMAWHSYWTSGDSGWSESFNGGQTWTNHPPGGAGWGAGNAIWFMNDSQTMLLGSQNSGIWRTTNGGTSWTRISTTPITHGGNNSLVRIGNTYYLAHSGVIEQSTDGGATWTNISSGLPGAVFASVATDGTYLYTAPYFPVLPGYINGPWYRRLVSGGSWTPVTNSPNTCTRGACNGPVQTAYDSAGRVAYAANGTGGIWRLRPGT